MENGVEAQRGFTLWFTGLSGAGKTTVSEIVEATSLTQSNVSNHLACLRDCGLVTAEQHGRFVHYELSDPRVGQLLILADELLGHVAQGVYQCTRYDVKVLQHG